MSVNIIAPAVGNFARATLAGTQVLGAFVRSNTSQIATVGRAAQAAFDNALDGNRSSVKNLGTFKRMAQNAIQGVDVGANPNRPNRITASIRRGDQISGATDGDWRVSLEVPTQIGEGVVLDPLISQTNSRMVFPFNPVVLLSQRANYDNMGLTHTNYPFHAYQNSQIDDITVTGDFYVENESDARYWIACVHFLRTMTKMFYGNGDHIGAPPLLSRLNGYGKYVLNDIPVLITNFTVDLQSNIDYIPCRIIDDEEPNYVPTHSTISVTCTPNYSRRSVSQFDLKAFANGDFVNKGQGFI